MFYVLFDPGDLLSMCNLLTVLTWLTFHLDEWIGVMCAIILIFYYGNILNIYKNSQGNIINPSVFVTPYQQLSIHRQSCFHVYFHSSSQACIIYSK